MTTESIHHNTFNSSLLPDKQIGVSEEVGIHLQQRPFLKNKRRQNDLGQIHADADLREEVGDKAAVRLH